MLRLSQQGCARLDPRASAQWWIEMFGGTALPEATFKTMLFAPVEFRGGRISFSTPAPGEEDVISEPPASPHYALEHLGIQTDDLEADLERFREQGLPIDGPRPGAYGIELAFVETPDGVLLELMQFPE